MKLFFASLVIVSASAITTVSAVDDTPTCHEFHKPGDDGDIEVLYTDDLLSYDSLLAHSDYLFIGAVGGPCSECDCDPDKFPGLVLEPGCEENEHSFRDAAGVKTTLDISYKCEYEVPTVTVCTKTLSFDHDGKKATSSWKTSEQPIINRQRNLRAGRHLSDIEFGQVRTGSCEEMVCDDKCPDQLIDNDVTYNLDENASCEEDSERGRCSYTNPLYTNEDIDTDEDIDTPCIDVCVIKNKSVEQECYDPAKAAACDDSDCYEGTCDIADCNALCPEEGCAEEYGGIDDLDFEGYECIDPVEDDVDDEKPKPEKDLSGSVCKKLDENTFEEVTLAVVVDEPRNAWRLGECKDPQNEKFYCKKFPMEFDETSRTFYCDPSRR